ncbi:response regulator transcription factor [Streptomyces sp. NPDC001985]|uniref:response regulator transcription factor n=1 Tax=Streptomyces sp. NPDC001985 TaxID=3154406 RepID=UPI0033237312
MRIRVLIVDGERLVLEALSAMLAEEEDLDVVAQATTAARACDLARRLTPDVCVLDLNTPDREGLGIVRELGRALPSLRCVVVTSRTAPGHVRAALRAGARGFVPKTASARELADTIRAVHRGGRRVDADLAAETICAGDSPLTPRETDILSLSADGAPIATVALRAVLTQGTARNHLSSITGKLKVANRHEAIHLARRRGWI